MTDKEKAIIMAHTGICMLTGDKFQIFHKYIEDVMGRPIMTHEIGFLADEIKEKTKDDFIKLCADESSWKKEKYEDCISRQAVFDLIEHYNSDGLGSVFYGYQEGIKFADAINKLPPVTPTQKWIPVSERLPKENGRYLVTRGLNACGSLWNRVYIVNYSDLMGLKKEKIWWDGNVGKSDFKPIDDVIAWMPLPEPYKAEMERKE